MLTLLLRAEARERDGVFGWVQVIILLYYLVFTTTSSSLPPGLWVWFPCNRYLGNRSLAASVATWSPGWEGLALDTGTRSGHVAIKGLIIHYSPSMCMYIAIKGLNSPSMWMVLWPTVEPPNKGHVGTRSFVLYREVSFIRRLKCTGIIGWCHRWNFLADEWDIFSRCVQKLYILECAWVMLTILEWEVVVSFLVY